MTNESYTIYSYLVYLLIYYGLFANQDVDRFFRPRVLSRRSPIVYLIPSSLPVIETLFLFFFFFCQESEKGRNVLEPTLKILLEVSKVTIDGECPRVEEERVGVERNFSTGGSRDL